MIDLVRRTNLLVSLGSFAGLDGIWKLNADAITLDLRDAIGEVLSNASRKWLRISEHFASFGGAEVFLAVDCSNIQSQLDAAIWPGISGVLLSGADDESSLRSTSSRLEEMEGRRGIGNGTLEIIPVLQTAEAVWRVGEIIDAVPRIRQVVLDESSLARDIDIQPNLNIDPFVYARGRVVAESISRGIQPVGAPHPLSTLHPELTEDYLMAEGVRIKDLGFKGMLFQHANWVSPFNSAFSPGENLVEYYEEVRRLFAEGVARGTAAVPLGKRMIDVPVDEWAKAVLARSASCKARDQQKLAAEHKFT